MLQKLPHHHILLDQAMLTRQTCRFIFSPGVQAAVQPLAEAMRVSGHVPDAMSLTRGMIIGLASAPYVFSGIRDALTPEINSIAVIAGSQATLQALGFTMEPGQIAAIGEQAADVLHGTLNKAAMTMEERAQAFIVGASLAGGMGPEEAAKLLQKGGVEASKPFAEGIKAAIKKASEAMKASGLVIGGIGAPLGIAGTILGFYFGVKDHKTPDPITTTVYALSTTSAATMQYITQSLQGTASTIVEVTKTVDTTGKSSSEYCLNSSRNSQDRSKQAMLTPDV